MRPIILLLPLATLVACSQPEKLPIPVWLDCTWTPDERQALMDAMAAWDRVTMDRLREPRLAFSYRGTRCQEFTANALNDEEMMIFKLAEPTPETEMLDAESQRDCGKNCVVDGYGPHSIMLMTFHLPTGQSYLKYLRAVATHEMGHTLGIAHFSHRPGLMNPILDVLTIQPSDIEALCTLYDCRP